MFNIKEFVQPKTLEEAYNLLVNKRNNTLLGGTVFLRLGNKRIGSAIDLSKLDLNYVKEEEGYIELGALTTFRELETNPLLANNFNGVLAKAVKNIIGVQFRNVVTLGASVFSKYGFSDVITALLALKAEVELFKGGRIFLEEFLQRPYEKDILTKIFIKNEARQASYQDLRNSATDYPVLNVAVSRFADEWTIVVGARPRRAAIAKKASEELTNNFNMENLDQVAELTAEELSFGTNARGTAQYRKAICKALVKRAITEVLACK